MANLQSHALLQAALLSLVSLAGTASWAQAHTVLAISAYPAVDEIAKAAIPAFKKKHPEVEVSILKKKLRTSAPRGRAKSR